VVDVPSYAARHHLGIEEAARGLRYRALIALARATNAWAVVTGHTRDDQAETVLINIVRGTGLLGLGGMRDLQTLRASDLGPTDGCVADLNGEARVARPLLEVGRLETELYCRALGLPFRSDPSNSDPALLRNRVRLHLLPLLRTYSPAIDSHLAQLGEIAGGDEEALDEVMQSAWWAAAQQDSGSVSFRWALWRTQSTAIQRRLLRRSVRHLGGAQVSFRTLEAARRLVEQEPPARQLNLGSGLRLETSRQGFRLQRAMATEGAASSKT
jgi:tRNA(Ile)-lysidine synthase